MWNSSYTEYFQALEVFAWEEPNAEDFTDRISKDIPDIKVIEAPPGIKDISEANIQGKNVLEWFEELKFRAVSYRELHNQVCFDNTANKRLKLHESS